MKKLFFILLATGGLLLLLGCATELPSELPSEQAQEEVAEIIEIEPTSEPDESEEIPEINTYGRLNDNAYFWRVEPNPDKSGVLVINRIGAAHPGRTVQIAEIDLKYKYGETSPQLLDGKIYFLNAGELQVLDLETEALGAIEIPVASEVRVAEYLEEHPEFDINIDEAIPLPPPSSEQIFDALVTEDVIVYLAGSCVEGGYCYLGIYNRETRQSRLLSDDLFAQAERQLFSAFRVYSYDPSRDEVLITFNGGDGGGVWASLYKVIDEGDFYHGNPGGFPLELVDSGGTYLGICDEETTQITGESVAECEQSRDRYHELAETPILYCGTHSFKETYEGVVMTSETGLQGLIPDVEIIGCYE